MIVKALAFSKNSDLLISGSPDSTITIMNVSSIQKFKYFLYLSIMLFILLIVIYIL